MGDAYFRILDESPTDGRYAAAAATGGPWDAGLQHGGPPSALLVRAAERVAADAGRSDLIATRLAVEFVGPVPVDEIVVAARMVRAARTAMLVECTVTAGQRACLQGRVWLVRSLDTSEVALPVPPPGPAPRGLGELHAHFPYGETIDWQAVSASMHVSGPGSTWARPMFSLVDGESLSGLQRVALVGDSASGISSELDWDEWSFVNVDLDVHLARPIDGDWVLIDAVTTLGTHGAALARSTVSDLRGQVGCTAQTLVLSPRNSLADR